MGWGFWQHGIMIVGIVQKERERERGQGIDFFLKQICTKIYCLFSESKIHYIFVFDSSPPPLPSPRCEGRAKKKEKEKKKKTRRTHSPHLTLHQCGIYRKPNPPPPPGRFKPLYPAAAPHIHTPPHHRH